MRPYRTRLQYSHLKTRRLVAGSALIIFPGRSERRKEKKMEVDRKTRVVRRRNVRWTRRLCSGRISKSERRSALTHQCICFILYSQLQIGTIEVPSECLCLFSDSLTVFFLNSWMKTARPVTQKTPHKILSLAAPIISYSTWAALGNQFNRPL